MAETSNRATHPPPYAEPEAQELIEEPGTDLRYYWHAVWRRKWAILGLVIAVGLFSVVRAYSLQPIYRSTAMLLIGGYDRVMNTLPERSFSAPKWNLFSRGKCCVGP